jgi:hypothetical protein
MLRLDSLELVQETIEFLVGDLGIVEDVVPLFVVPDGHSKLVDAQGWRYDHIRRSARLAAERHPHGARSPERLALRLRR